MFHSLPARSMAIPCAHNTSPQEREAAKNNAPLIHICLFQGRSYKHRGINAIATSRHCTGRTTGGGRGSERSLVYRSNDMRTCKAVRSSSLSPLTAAYRHRTLYRSAPAAVSIAMPVARPIRVTRWHPHWRTAPHPWVTGSAHRQVGEVAVQVLSLAIQPQRLPEVPCGLCRLGGIGAGRLACQDSARREGREQ